MSCETLALLKFAAFGLAVNLSAAYLFGASLCNLGIK